VDHVEVGLDMAGHGLLAGRQLVARQAPESHPTLLIHAGYHRLQQCGEV
jgi:hypothetical protein